MRRTRGRPKGTTRRDALLALRAAALKDYHGVSYAIVGEVYGWRPQSRGLKGRTSRTAEEYVRLGREIRAAELAKFPAPFRTALDGLTDDELLRIIRSEFAALSCKPLLELFGLPYEPGSLGWLLAAADIVHLYQDVLEEPRSPNLLSKRVRDIQNTAFYYLAERYYQRKRSERAKHTSPAAPR